MRVSSKRRENGAERQKKTTTKTIRIVTKGSLINVMPVTVPSRTLALPNDHFYRLPNPTVSTSSGEEESLVRPRSKSTMIISTLATLTLTSNGLWPRDDSRIPTSLRMTCSLPYTRFPASPMPSQGHGLTTVRHDTSMKSPLDGAVVDDAPLSPHSFQFKACQPTFNLSWGGRTKSAR